MEIINQVNSSPSYSFLLVSQWCPGKLTPTLDVVQCTNAGFDGSDVQWKCQADLPHNLRFGELNVNCEGKATSFWNHYPAAQH